MKRLPLILLALAVLGSAGFGLMQLKQVDELRASMAAWEKERADLQKRLWELQKRNRELENRRPATAAGAVADAPPAPPDDDANRPAGFGPAASRDRPDRARFAAMASNPVVQQLMAMQQKSALDGRYASLFKQLQLNPAQLEKFKSLLVEKQSALMDVMSAAREEGLNGRENRDQLRELVTQAQNEVNDTIRATLGDSAYAQYQSYEATFPQRNVVGQLEQRLSYSATPLTDAQSLQLVQILAETSPTSAGSGGGNPMRALLPGGGAGGSVPISSDAIARAQGVLAPQQVAALQSLQQEQQAAADLMKQMRAARNGATSTTTQTTTSVSSTPIPGGAR